MSAHPDRMVALCGVDRMVALCGVSRSVPGPGGRPRVVLHPSDLDIPTDRPVAILGGRGAGKTTLLELLAGRLRPDPGGRLLPPAAWRPGDGFSPVLNAGRLLHPGLTGYENARFVARLYGLDADALLRAVDAFSGLGAALGERVRALEGGARRVLECSLAIMLPFACTLLDDAQQLPAPVLTRCLAAARARGAGLIFATAVPRLACSRAESVIVIADGILQREDDAAAIARLDVASLPQGVAA